MNLLLIIAICASGFACIISVVSICINKTNNRQDTWAAANIQKYIENRHAWLIGRLETIEKELEISTRKSTKEEINPAQQQLRENTKEDILHEPN